MTTDQLPTVNRVRTLFGAMSTGNSAVLLEMLGDDVVWHVAGRNSLSGTYHGPQQFLGVVQRFTEMTANNFSLELVDILADERHASLIAHVEAQRDDRRLRATAAVGIVFDEAGKVAELWHLNEDQAAYDAFFA